MSSTGLKLRDTRELLARPDLNQAKESVHLHLIGSLQSQEVSIGAKELSTEETVNSMSPSLAMANANSSPSNQNESLSKETIALENSSREIEPIPKKKRILEASEILQEFKESEKQTSSSEDILARACSAVGIGGDISDSVVEDSLPNHQDHNGEIHRVAPNYPYTRGLRIPPQSIPLSPRLRPVDEIRIRHPFHPAFRPSSESTYGMEIRPLYNHGYPLPSRMPIHPNEAHRYYAVPRFSNRYPYGGPQGPIPPSIPRAPVLRPTPPNGPHERRPSIPHPNQGYPYDSHHIPRPPIHHVPPTVSQLHHEHRVEPSEIRHIHPATSETRPVQQSHPEIAYRISNQHSLAVGAVSPGHLSPTSIKHPYPQPGIPIPIQPKLHGNPQNHLQDSREHHARVNEAYASGVIHGIHPTTGSPHHNSPQELSCENPFQIPDLQSNKNMALVSKQATVASSYDVSSVKVLSSPLEKNKPELSIVSSKGNKIEQTEVEMMIESTTISRSTTQNSLLPRRPRQPPEPCVELIPILALSQEEKCSKGKLNEKIQLSPPVPSNSDIDRRQLGPLNTSYERQLTMDSQISICSPKTYHTEMTDIKQGESQPQAVKLLEKTCGIPLECAPNANSRINEKTVLEKEESTNKDPKKSFRKRWLDIQEYPSSKRPATQDERLAEQVQSLETQPPPEAVVKKEETTVIVLDDDEGVSEISKLYKPSGAISKGQVGPGQLHCLHSSVYINNMRSASEPPFGTPTQKNISPLGKRPASVPYFAQQLKDVKAPCESQNKVNTENGTAKEKDNDDEFVNRLKLVLNDLISVPVPEVSKLQHLTCPIDELLASLVKRRGALPSEASDPKERLRKDFLVLVKLCMPKDLLEDWGWNSSSPEEILDELIKVTNSGVEGSKGNARLNLTREVNNKTPSPQTLNNNSDTTRINHATPSPYPIASVSPIDQNSSPVPIIPLSSQHLENSNQATHPPPSLQRPLPSRHEGPILIRYPALSPQHRQVTHPPQNPSVSLNSVPTVSHSPHRPPQMSSQQSTALSTPMFHSSTPNSQQPSKWPLPRHSVPPISRQTILLSTNSEPPFSQPEDHLEDDVFTPTNRNPLPVTYSHPQMPVHHQKPVHESTSQNIKPTQEHDRYTSALTVQMPSQNSTHPHNIPITVLHYSQVPQPSPNTPYGQHSSHPYGSPGNTHNIHNPPLHFPRGAYPQPYPYAYFHPNNPHYPRAAYRHASIIHRPHNLPPRLPYSPRSPHSSPTSPGVICLIAQPPAPLSPSHWSEERIVSTAAIKPPA